MKPQLQPAIASSHLIAEAVREITRARIGLIINNPWFGTLAMKLQMLDSSHAPCQVRTMATDGTRMFYDPAFTVSLTHAEVQGVMAHEVMHCALLHPYRKENRDMGLWNIACDFAVNDLLIASGFILPKGVLHDKRYTGMSAERIYSLLQQEMSQGQSIQPGNGVGDVMEAPSPGTGKGDDSGKGDGTGSGDGKGDGQGQAQAQSQGPDRTATDWQIDVVQAEKIASSAGKLPGHLAEELRRSRSTKTNYRETLKRFMERTTPTDYTWAKPNRRMLGSGMVLPGIHKEGCGELVVVVDTSGSVGNWMLDQFAADIAEIIESVRPIKTHVIYCDTEVKVTEEYEPDGEEFQFARKVSRGGTYFQPAFDWVEANGVQPKAILYLTDLEPGDCPIDPGIPVLWCVPETCSRQSWPWGEVVTVTMDVGKVAGR